MGAQKNDIDREVDNLIVTELEKIADEKITEIADEMSSKKTVYSDRQAVIKWYAHQCSEIPEEILKGFVEIIEKNLPNKKMPHKKFVELFNNLVTNAGNKIVKAYVNAYLPRLERHFHLQNDYRDNVSREGIISTLRQNARKNFEDGVVVAQNEFGRRSLSAPKLSDRTYVVDQMYTYSNFEKALTNIRSELINAWACRVEVEKCYARLEEIAKAKEAGEEGVKEGEKKKKKGSKKAKGKELTEDELKARIRECSEMEYTFYDLAKRRAVAETKKYWSLHTPRKPSLVAGKDVDFPELNVDKADRIVLPIGEQFYPNMFEMFLRSHMPPLPAFSKGRGVQAQAEYEISGRELHLKRKESLTRKEKAQLKREEKEWKSYLNKVTTEFRNFKDRLRPNKKDPLNIRLLDHMTDVYTLQNHKYVEAFEMLSREYNKKEWNDVIMEWEEKYDQYVKWAADNMDYYYRMYATNVNTYSDQHNAQSILATGSHDTPELQRARAIYKKWKAAEEKRKAAKAAQAAQGNK